MHEPGEKFRKAMTNAHGHTFEVHYKDGHIIEGWVSGVYLNSSTIIITIPDGGIQHDVQFARIAKLIYKPYGKPQEIIE